MINCEVRSCLSILLVCASSSLLAVDETRATASAGEPEISEVVERSIERACGWLAKNQQRDGSQKSSYPVAASALAGLAWMAAGSTPHEGTYCKNIMATLEYVHKCCPKNGFISENGAYGPSGMYGHGYSIQFLAQAYGMIRSPDLAEQVKDDLTKAVHVTEMSQNQYGGWNSSPNGSLSDDGSGAIAVMQITALRSAEACGVQIKAAIIEKAKKYLLGMTNDQGWYAYNWHARNSGRGSLATTGAGMYMLGVLNLHTEPKYVKGIKNIMSSLPGTSQDGSFGGWYAYSIFYASLAIFQHGGEEWRKWYPAMCKQLLKTQSADGSWQDSYGGVFVALTVLSLELPYRYLPMFQDGGAGMEGR